MAKIMDVNRSREPGLGQCPRPRLGEVAAPELATLTPTNTKPSGPAAANVFRWRRSSGTISSGRTTLLMLARLGCALNELAKFVDRLDYSEATAASRSEVVTS